MPKRPRKPKPPPSYHPWRCIILSIDPGKRSGAAIFYHGELLFWKACDTYDEMLIVCKQAHEWADIYDVPLVVAIETWNPHGKWSHASKLGTAESAGVWKQAVKELPRRRPTTKVVRVLLDKWRKVIYGFCRAPHKDFDWKAHALRVLYQRQPITAGKVLDHNVAEAIFIGECATRMGEVGALAGVKAA